VPKYVEHEFHFHHETCEGDDDQGALLLSLEGDEDEAVWLPKSKVIVVGERVGFRTIRIPEWLWVKKFD
jgi:hypothetical protein